MHTPTQHPPTTPACPCPCPRLLQELPSEVGEVPSPRVLDASDNALTRLPPQLPTTLNRLVLSNNRLTSLAFLQQLTSLRVSARLAVGPDSGVGASVGFVVPCPRPHAATQNSGLPPACHQRYSNSLHPEQA